MMDAHHPLSPPVRPATPARGALRRRLLARGSMTALAAVAALLGFMVAGGINLQLAAGIPASTVTVVQALMIIVIAGAAAWTVTGRRRRPAPQLPPLGQQAPNLEGATR